MKSDRGMKGIRGSRGYKAGMLVRAFTIADESMLELLQGHCIRGDEYGLCYQLTDKESRAVDGLAESDEAVQEAMAWLQPRGLAEIQTDPDGREYVLINPDVLA